MEDVLCYCPICNGQVLFEAIKNLDPDVSGPLVEGKAYCPRCEVLIEPIIKKVTVAPGSHPEFRSETPEERGRGAAAGSNAGGSQRGDASDEGATQWRVDPREAERNTWQDKP
jgi:hypothetical protein